MVATRLIHMYQVFLYATSKGCSCMAKMDMFLLFKVICLMLRSGFKDGCY